MNMGKRNIAILILIGIVAGGFFWKSKHRHYTPKTADEFFKRNPHLVRPVSRMQLPPDQLRLDDKFKDGDYQLLANHAYPIDFYQSANFAQADQPTQLISSKGKLLLRSLGLMKGRLVLLAEFKFDQAEEMKKLKPKALEEFGIIRDSKKQPTPEQLLARSVLIKLEPTGRIREMYVHDPKVSQVSLGAKLKLLDEIFKPIPSTKAGSLIKTEIDEVGYPYKMNYDIADEGPFIRIKATANQTYGLNDTESKAAASGAQGMGMLSLKGQQSASVDWQWIKSEQRPRSQNSQSETELSVLHRSITQATGTSKITWGDARDDSDIESMASKFTHPINIEMLRAILRSKQRKSIGNGASHPVMAKGGKRPQLTPEQARERAFQEMTDLIKTNPAQIGSFRSMAMNEPPTSERISMALGALGYEGSAESQKALMDVYGRSDLTERNREKVLVELTLVDQPLDPEVKKFLKKEFTKVDYANSRTAKQAGLALGSSIARDGDPETIQFLHDTWDQIGSVSKNPADKRGRQNYMLKTMGNSKSDVFMSESRSMSGSSDPMLRSASADSVRFAQSQDSRDLLFGLLEDENPEVRTMVAQSLRYQPFDDRTKSALQGCVSDPDAGVKINCYRILTYNINQPGIREFLSGRSGSESDPQVKRTINEALSVEVTNPSK